MRKAAEASSAPTGRHVVTLTSPAGTIVSFMVETPKGVKAYIETDEANKIQWVSVRGTSNLDNVKLDVDYNKVVDGRLQIPLHKGFADTALQVYAFAKPLLRPGYEVRVTGHSLGGAAAAIVLMLFKEDGVKLGQAMTFGQPKVTNRAGVEKYRGLPLLRFVNDKDPVPLLPPFDLTTILEAIADAMPATKDADQVAEAALRSELLGLVGTLERRASGDLDLTFSGDGKLVQDVVNGQASVAVDSKSRIVLAGKYDPAGPDGGDVLVYRYLPDGTLDNSFSADGSAARRSQKYSNGAGRHATRQASRSIRENSASTPAT